MSVAEKPHRRFELLIRISGDTWDDVVHQARDLLPHIEEHGPRCNSVSGGYSGGHFVDVTERPEMTHDRYVVELDAYLRATKATCAGGCGATKDELSTSGHRSGCKLA